MKHLKEQKEHQPMSKGKKIAICVVIGLLVAGGVFAALYFINRIEGYREASNYTGEILSTKDKVEAYLNRKLEGETLSDEDKKVLEEFEAAIEKAESYTESLGASKALKDKNVNEKYETAKEALKKLTASKSLESEIMKILEDDLISDDELADLEKGEGEFLKKMAEDLKGYRQKINDFNKKYENLKGADKKQLDEDYAAITNAGQELTKKYTEIKFDDVFGMSRDDILHFYETIEELDHYLAEKI